MPADELRVRVGFVERIWSMGSANNDAMMLMMDQARGAWTNNGNYVPGGEG